MTTMALDHVTLGARTLAEGAAYVREVLGVDIPAGGKHGDMATHNHVMRIGDGVFLELLAIDPEAPKPARTRWFGMDDPDQTARLTKGPSPIGWVVSTDDLDAALGKCPLDLGKRLFMSRGTRSWRITVPDDGCMPFGGLVPALMQWSDGPHPSSGMQFPGPTLQQIVLKHPEADKLQVILEQMGVSRFVIVEQGAVGASMALVFRRADGELRTLA